MISEFFYQIANLKTTQRSGWKSKLDLLDSESVADHSYMMSVMAMVISDIKNMNTEKIIKMSILHDWAESKIGDFMPGEISQEEKNELEGKAMTEILSNLPDKLQNDYHGIWNDYNKKLSLESKFVHQLDKLEMVLQAKIYESDTDYEKIKPFLISSLDLITDDDLKTVLSEIIQ
ncbi:MAG: HD domain-containing protein [Candidatus Nitrosopelagicus sp.]|jgi:putative hydrolase of HD superfamily|nr:HD domain-containing protein [Candidatus Nitrosopelagicus sp.]